MKLLILDFETQSDDPATTNPTEVGAILLELPSHKLDPETAVAKEWKKGAGYEELVRLSELIYHVDYPPQTPEIVELTGITDEMLNLHGKSATEVFAKLLPLTSEADLILAHNAAFDRGVYEATCKRLGLSLGLTSQKWVCTLNDVPYPAKYRCKKLAHLAYDHGILVHPDTLHRAIEDVQLLMRLILEQYNIHDILAYRNTPWAYLRAVIPGPWQGPGGDGGVGKAQASKLGYSWEKARGTSLPTFPKMWVKRVKETEIENEKAKSPFKVTRLIPQTEQAPVI